MVGAPELEGADPLEVLGLEVDLGADQRVQGPGAQHGGAVDDALDAVGGGAYVVQGDGKRGGHGSPRVGRTGRPGRDR